MSLLGILRWPSLAPPTIYAATAPWTLDFDLPTHSGGGLPTQARGPTTASHRMTRACPHVEPTPHTSTPGGASNTTAPPVAGPPSPWPPRDCPCAPTSVCRPASAPR